MIELVIQWISAGGKLYSTVVNGNRYDVMNATNTIDFGRSVWPTICSIDPKARIL